MKQRQPGMDLENPACILQAIRKVQAFFIHEQDPSKTFASALETLIEITGSQFGFLDEVLIDENGERYKLNLAISNIAWDDDSRQFYEELAGLPFLERRTIISNDPAHDPRAGGVPKGHPAINSFMGIPMISGGEVVGVVGVANRAGGYTEEMAVLLEPLITAYTGIVLAARVKRREQEHMRALQANEEKFRTVADFTYDWEYWISPKGDILYMSPSCERVSGYRVDAFLSDSSLLTQIVHPEDRDAVHAHVQEETEPRVGNESLDYRIITGDGKERWISHYCVPVFRKDGVYLGRRTSCRDITGRKQVEEQLRSYHTYLEDLVKERTGELEERNRELAREVADHKKTEIALRESEARYRILAANASDIIFTTDTDLRFTYISPSVSRIRGYTVEEAMSQSIADALTPASLEIAMKVYQEELEYESRAVKEPRGPRTLELEETCKDGSTVWTETTFSFLHDEQNGLVGILGITRDISRRKQAEEEKRVLMNRLAQTQKMEALGKFAGGIVHDLNNFLYPILVNTQMLLEESFPGSASHQTLTQSLHAIYRLRDLIKQVLSFSRSGGQQLNPVQVKPLIRDTLAMLKSVIPRTVKIKQIMNGPLDLVLGDPTQIQQIIMNLCMNAVEAMDTRTGKIEVRLENTYLEPVQGPSEAKAGRYLCLAVKDNGIGMTEEVMGHVFEPFFTTKGTGKGTGMGLAVIHGIIRNHGGMITVESDPGKGTQFNVYLPLISVESPVGEQMTCPVKGNRTILLIDDEEIILKSLQRLLKSLGYDVITVKSGIEAIEIFSRIPECIDLIITDMTMPGMTGVELAGKLLLIRADIPIILCTGFNDAISVQQAKEIGIKGLLEKPADVDELKSAIGLALPRENHSA